MSEKKKLSSLAYQEVPGDEYPPVVSASEKPAEFTLKAILIGVVIGIVFGAANAYLGLKVGQTVSASIPAAVMAVAIFKFFKNGGTLLESNLVQTIGSAGESLAAGVIFTIPAFFIWGADITLQDITIISVIGGLIGVLFMVPLRKGLIVNEHGKLPYPEGTACAEVLVSGQGDASKAKPLFWGMGLGALYTALSHNKLFGLWNREPVANIAGYKGAQISGELSPELLAVGYIIGPKISAVMFSGAFLAWFVLIPMIVLFGKGNENVISPATNLIRDMSPGAIWSSYIKYIGAGAVAFAGLFSLFKSIPLMLTSFRNSFKQMKQVGKDDSKRTNTDLSFKTLVIFLAVLTIASIIYAKIRIFPNDMLLSFLMGILIVVFGFFFVSVSSRIVGMLGSSSNPISGMTIATLLLTCIVFSLFGLYSTPNAKVAILYVGAFICIASAIAGDASQDLKTGFLVGSTPKHQQIGEIIGVITASLTMGFVMFFMKEAISSGELSAPQANLMKTLIEGIVDGNLPWGLVICGASVALVVEMLGINSLSFAVGMYLPISVSSTIVVGGLIRLLVDRKKNNSQTEEKRERGVLYSSGLIAGSALLGVIMMVVVAFADNLSGILTPISRAGIHIETELTDVSINGQPCTDKYFKVTPIDIGEKGSKDFVIKASYQGKPVEETLSLGKLDRAYLSVQNGKLVSESEAPSSNARALIAFSLLVLSLYFFCNKKI